MEFIFKPLNNGTNRETAQVTAGLFIISIHGEINTNNYTVWRQEGNSMKLTNPKNCGYTKERAILKAVSLLKIALQTV